MATALTNARVMLLNEVRSDLCVVVDNGRIAAVTNERPADANCIDLGGELLLPGFIDVQVNGGGGRLFNDDPSVETIAIMAAAPGAVPRTLFLGCALEFKRFPA